MNSPRRQGGWVILASFLFAYLLTVIALPQSIETLRPDWVALVLIYWCMALPQRVGVGIGWLAGLGQDALQSTLLGQHALAYAVLAFLMIKLHQRIRVFPLWQQALTVLMLLLLTRIILWWVGGFIGRAPEGVDYWLAAVSGTILWPAIFVLMREFRQGFSVR